MSKLALGPSGGSGGGSKLALNTSRGGGGGGGGGGGQSWPFAQVGVRQNWPSTQAGGGGTKLALCTSGGGRVGGKSKLALFSEVEVVVCVNTEDNKPQQQHPVRIVKTLTKETKPAGCTYSSSFLRCTQSCWRLFWHFRGCSHTHPHTHKVYISALLTSP